MKRYFAFFLAITFTLLLQGCYSQGSSAPAPTNVNVVAGDTSATVTWDMLPEVEYWVFKAAASEVTPENCFGTPGCQMIMKAVSPTVISGLVNGTTYSFSINGRIGGGKGGPGSPSIQAVPRLAGATWSAGTALGIEDMHGVAYGTVYVAAGNNAALLSSADGVNWTALTNPVPTANLNAVAYSAGKYLATGASGVILLSTDGVTWQPQTSNTANDLYAVAGNGLGGFVATGAFGTIVSSVDGLSWTCVSCPVSGTALYGVTYGNGMYVTVGAAGTLLTSLDGIIWSNPSSISANDLKGVAYAPVIGTTGTGTFVAVGANGTVVTSTDGGTTWSSATSSFSSTTVINAVTYGRQFVAVANDGSIFTSIDGLSWSPTTSTPANLLPLYAVAHGLYDYTAVGGSGLNMHAK